MTYCDVSNYLSLLCCVMSFIVVYCVYYFDYFATLFLCFSLHIFVHLSKAFDFTTYLLLTACVDVYIF